MQRVVVIGNSGGGKSTLARKLAARFELPHFEIDGLLWKPGWHLAAPGEYDREHDRLIAQDEWILDGLGTRESTPARLARATEIILIDMPIWTHFWLAAERHYSWRREALPHPPAGIPEAPPMQAVFKAMWDIDREWIPELRRLVADEEARGKFVFRLGSIDELNDFSSRL